MHHMYVGLVKVTLSTYTTRLKVREMNMRRLNVTVCARHCGLHTQKYWTTNFFLFLLSLFKSLMLRIHQKFKAQARKKTLASVCNTHTHTHVDKIDCFIHVKNNYFFYKLLHLTIDIKATIPGTLCRNIELGVIFAKHLSCSKAVFFDPHVRFFIPFWRKICLKSFGKIDSSLDFRMLNSIRFFKGCRM